jgi:MFS family permease
MSSDAVRSEIVPTVGAFSALNEPAFRLYFVGQLVSVSGTWMQQVAQQVVVYELTKSELALGLVACAQGIPALLLTPLAGVIVDSFPRRKILIFTQIMQMLLAFVMAYLVFANVLQVWHIVLLSLGIGIGNAIDAPARQAFMIEMVGKEHLPSGIMLGALMFNSARIIGPAFGGIALRQVGPAWCFFLNGISFLAVLFSLIIMTVPHMRQVVARTSFLGNLKDGLRFVRGHASIRPILMLSAVTSGIGITFMVLTPAFADQVLHDTTGGTAALATAQGIGAVLAGVAVAWANKTGRRGRVMMSSAVAAPLMVIIFALTGSFVTSLPAIALSGFFFISQFVLMNTLIQTQVEDDYRGRVLSLYTISFMGLNPFGSLVIGMTAQTIGTVPAILACGVLGTVGVGFILSRALHLWRLH